MIKPGLLAAAALVLSAPALAQFSGNLPNQTVLGNNSGSPAPARPIPFSNLGNFAGTNWSFIVNPAQTVQQMLKFNSTVSGTMLTAPSDQNASPLLWFRHEGALIGLGVNTSVALAEFDYNDTGTIVNNDSFVGLGANCNLKGIRPNAGIPGGTLAAACIGATIGARGYTHQGGNLGASQPQGEIHGLNIVAGVTDSLGSTPSDYDAHIGDETDMVGCVGCTVKHRIGKFIVDFGNGAGGTVEQGTVTDAAVAIGSVSGTAGWLYGIDLVGSPLIGGNALSNTGTVLGSSASSPTVATNGIDLNNFLISGKAFRAPGDAFYVTGAGDTLGKSITATAGLITDAAVGANAVVDLRSGGATRWNVGREATTLDYIVKDTASGQTVIRATAAADGLFLGVVPGVTIDAAGSVLVGNPAGGQKGVGTLNIQNALWTNGTQGITCGPGAPTAAFHVIGGVVVAC